METVVHISDLHLSTTEARRNLESLRTVISELTPQPKLLIVSGDLLDHPEDGVRQRLGKLMSRSSQDQYGLEQVKSDLQKIADSCAPGCQLVVVPGNHDCRDYGVVALKNQGLAFEKAFSNWKAAQHVTVGGRDIVIFKIDSNTNDARINAARGRVGTDEFNRLHREVQRMRKELLPDRFELALKIAVVHHHPLPIADSEDRPYFQRDGFLGLDDAGIFLREMAVHNIDIVLHGHKHHPFNSRIEINYNDKRRGLAVIAAGSATKDSEPFRSFNLLRISPQGVNGQLWKQTTGGAAWSQTDFPIISYDRHLVRRFEDTVSTLRRCYERVELTYSLSAEGDSDLYGSYIGLSTLDDSLPSMEVGRVCPHGTISDFGWHEIKGSFSTVRFERSEQKQEPGRITGIVKFTPPLAPGGKNSYRNHCRLFNSFALTQEQRARMADPGKPPEEEFVHVGFKNPVKLVTLAVSFAKISLPQIVRAEAVNAITKTADQLETIRCQQHLRVCEVTQVATLTLANPLGGIDYKIVWSLPPAPPARYHDRRHGQVDAIRKALLLQLPKQNALMPIFEVEANQLAREYAVNSYEFEFGLMAFDRNARHLRFVAGKLREATWNYTLFEGQGIAGRAHKLERAFFVNTEVKNPDLAYLSPPPDGMPIPPVIIAVPLRFPFITPEGEGDTVAVLLISSYSNATRLSDVCTNRAASHYLIGQAQLFFVEKVLPALGLQEHLQPWGRPTGSAAPVPTKFLAESKEAAGVTEFTFRVQKPERHFSVEDLRQAVDSLKIARDKENW